MEMAEPRSSRSGSSSDATTEIVGASTATPPSDRTLSASTSFITAEDDFSDEGYANSTDSSYVTSIASNIRRGVLEHGRIFPDYGQNMYGFPMDEAELARLDLQHAKIMLILDGKLHLAPIVDHPQRILDLGTGTGIWAIDMGDRYPSAEVTGVDIAPTQPSWIPSNVKFEIDDVEAEWFWKEDIYDFIHIRELMLAIRDWDKLLEKAFTRLKPGAYVELGGTVVNISSDDGSIPPNSSYVEAGRLLGEMGDKMGTPVSDPFTWKGRLERLGFVNVTEVRYKLPLGSWPKDKRLKHIGIIEQVHVLEGIEAYMLRGYTKVLGGRYEDLQILLANTRNELKNPKMHSYVYYVCAYGQRPPR